jgi:hypothetical protein
MFGSEHSIPPSYEINHSKLKGGLINTDTCNGARLLAQLLVDAVDFAVEENLLSRMEVPRTCGARVRLWRYGLAIESILNGMLVLYVRVMNTNY